MERNIQNQQDAPMEEDDVEVVGDDLAINDGKRHNEKPQGIGIWGGHSRQNVGYPVSGTRSQGNEMRNSYLMPDEYIFAPLSQTEVEGSLDEEDMEIQRLTQSLSHLGTGRFQQSLITDSRIINSGASTSDADS